MHEIFFYLKIEKLIQIKIRFYKPQSLPKIPKLIIQ